VVDDSLMLAQMRDALAYGQLRLRRLDQAEDLFAKARATREAELGPDHPDTVNTRDGLAQVLLAKKRFAEAARLYSSTLLAREASLGPGHADSITSRRGLADALDGLKQKDDATRLLAENVGWYEATLGTDHNRTLAARQNLAQRYRAQKDYASAVHLLEANRAYYLARTAPRAFPLGRLTTELLLADMYVKLGRAAEVIDLLRPRIEMDEGLNGPDNPSDQGTRELLAKAYLAAGENAKAIPLLESSIRVSERMLASFGQWDGQGATMGRIRRCSAQIQLGRTYDRTGQVDKARAQFTSVEKMLRSYLDDDKGLLGDKATRQAARHGLAEVLVAQKRYAEAEPHLLAVYQNLTGQPEPDPDEVRPVVDSLVEVYAASGKANEKAKWEEKLRALPAAPKGSPGR
jgi:tetratricopeptide (TPR) repeat protein